MLRVTDLQTPDLDLAAYERELTTLAIPAAAADLLFREAATAYGFDDQPVTDEEVRAVYDLIKWGPTSMNTQPLRVVLVRSPEARARLVEQMGGANRERTAGAPLVAILAADLDFHDELPRVFPVYPTARDRFAADDAARHEAAVFNATLQMGYFLVGVRAAGLTAGPMTGFDADAVTREFFPDGRHRALMVVNLGHPVPHGTRPRQPRLAYDEVVTTV